MKNLETKQSAVDLTELAIGVIILGVVVAVGSTILIQTRDTHLGDLTTVTTVNETLNATTTGTQVSKYWVKSLGVVTNNTPTGPPIDSANYTFAVNDNGAGTITFVVGSKYVGNAVNVTYDWYNTSSRVDWTVTNQASAGLGEYGNWFKIIVIVGVAAVVLSLIFMAFGRKGGFGGSDSGVGGDY